LDESSGGELSEQLATAKRGKPCSPALPPLTIALPQPGRLAEKPAYSLAKNHARFSFAILVS